MEVNAILWSEVFAYTSWKALNVHPGSIFVAASQANDI